MPIGESHRHDETMPASSGKPGHARRARWLPGALGLVIGLPALLLLIVALLLPPEAIARAAAQRAQAALGVPVSIGDVGMDLWPVPSVALADVRLGPEDDALAHIERVLLRPRILPLFSGSVQVREIAVDRPTIHLAVDTAGALNLPFSRGGNGENDAGSNIDFVIDEFRIRGGRLSYRDARDGTDVQVRGLEQTLRIHGRVAAGSLARVDLDGAFSADSIDAALPARLAAPVHGIRLSVAHSAELDREADLLELRSVRVEVQRVALEGRGRIEAASDSLRRNLALELRTDPFSFEDLARSLPEGFLAALLAGRDADLDQPSGAEESEIDYAGLAEIDARISGLLTRDSIPQLQGEVRFREVAARRRDSSLLAGTGGTLAFSNKGVEGREIAGRMFGEPFGLSFRVVNLAAPVVSFATRGSARAEELLGILEMGDSVRAAGRIPFDLRGTVQPDDPTRATVEGTVGLGGVAFSLPSLLQAIQIESGQLRFVGTELRMEDLAATFGQSRVTASVVLGGWLPVALGDSTHLPEIAFDAGAGTLDLDALLGPSESAYSPLFFARLADRPVDGRSAAEAAAELGLTLPELPRLRAKGTLRAERLVRNGVSYQDVELEIESSPTAVSAPRLHFSMMGGSVDLGLAMERSERDATLTLVYHLENVGAGSFFSRFTPFQGHLSGLLSLDGEASLQLDEQLLPVRPTVQSSGSATLTGGSLANWPLLRSVGERLGLAAFDTLAFREWSGSFLVAGPLVSLERSLQVADRVETELAGTFDVAGRLDIGVVARLSPELVARSAEPIRAAARAASGEAGWVPLGLRITGTTTDPNVSLDLTAARDNAIAQARDKAAREAEAGARQAAAELTRRALGESTAIPPDSVGDALRSRVQDRLRGLFGRQQDRRPAPADTASPADTIVVEDDTVAGDRAGAPLREEDAL